MKYRCPECKNRGYYLTGSRLSTIINLHCNGCDEKIAEFDQQDFIK